MFVRFWNDVKLEKVKFKLNYQTKSICTRHHIKRVQKKERKKEKMMKILDINK